MLTDKALAEVNAELETASATRIVRWLIDNFGDDVCIASSMADTVAVAVALSVKPDLEVLFLDTQYHFPETWATVEAMQARYPEMRLKVMTPNVEPDERWKVDLEGCCGVRKVEPLERGLDGKKAWLTGLRRVDAVTRTVAPIVGHDKRGLVKVNHLASWTDEDVAGYAHDNAVPLHPLLAQGYPSIGCWPCTRPVQPGEDPRAGRWSGTGKVECGLHVG